MATRDILNYLGDKIGEMSEPEGVTYTEEQWAEKLAPFATAPFVPDASYLISQTVSQRRELAEQLIEKWKKDNILGGINIVQAMHVHHRYRSLPVTLPPALGGLSFTVDLLNMVVSGDLETAQFALKYSENDDMTMPYHWISPERKALWLADLAELTGINL